MSGPTTDSRAGELLRRHRETFGGPELPVPVESIAEDLLGLRIHEADDLADISGFLLPGKREIWVNGIEARESAGRRRFTIAHELGHWVCQALNGHEAPVYCRERDLGADGEPVRFDRALEREANVFAAELIMPAPALRAEFARTPRPAALASRFGVSIGTMRRRLYDLALVGGQPA